jgi:hypothetical protein
LPNYWHEKAMATPPALSVPLVFATVRNVPAATLLRSLAEQRLPAVLVVEHDSMVDPPAQVNDEFDGVTLIRLHVIGFPT